MSGKEFRRVIVWFRRDLRVADNRTLSAACAASDEVIPLFVVDDEILARPDTGPARVIFLLDALSVLDTSLNGCGGRLVVRRGKAPDSVVKTAIETEADAVFFQREVEPYGRARDENAARELQKLGKTVRTFSGLNVDEPGEILSQSGKPYTVFTPYKKVWFDRAFEVPCAAPDRVNVPADVHSDRLPTPEELNVRSEQKFECGGETAARKLLDTFVGSQLSSYEGRRDLVAEEGTSKLSRHLHFGTIAAGTIVHQARSTPGAEPFLNEIAWRDFYFQILFHFPHVEKGAFRRQFDTIKWEHNEVFFNAWCNGITGYPIVDAAMRQLNQEAWMHNRARMIVASFLTKDLLINWQLGERYFMLKLVDGDLAANNGGWQWCAGTGTDAQPYFRIFNPVSQGEKFDPTGAYVRRYVPELRKVPNAAIHSPWVLSAAEQEYCGCVLGKDYPSPIVDHKTQRLRALELYRSVGEQNI